MGYVVGVFQRSVLTVDRDGSFRPSPRSKFPLLPNTFPPRPHNPPESFVGVFLALGLPRLRNKIFDDSAGFDCKPAGRSGGVPPFPRTCHNPAKKGAFTSGFEAVCPVCDFVPPPQPCHGFPQTLDPFWSFWYFINCPLKSRAFPSRLTENTGPKWSQASSSLLPSHRYPPPTTRVSPEFSDISLPPPVSSFLRRWFFLPWEEAGDSPCFSRSGKNPSPPPPPLYFVLFFFPSWMAFPPLATVFPHRAV